ncbi:hypothetical protein [Brevibacterium renqingii]|uniref:hypothetical protein n=1 Tax=Brevibacterium renqingii TaxID=2776916 RepID=UPI001AE02B68|nr:hypothetical protein [Brevibacterium renqingii]
MYTDIANLAYTAPAVVAEGGVTGWINDQVDEFTESFDGLLLLIASILCLIIAFRTRTVLGAVTGFVLGVLVYWGGTNIDFGKDKVEEQVMGTPSSAVLMIDAAGDLPTVVDVG